MKQTILLVMLLFSTSAVAEIRDGVAFYLENKMDTPVSCRFSPRGSTPVEGGTTEHLFSAGEANTTTPFIATWIVQDADQLEISGTIRCMLVNGEAAEFDFRATHSWRLSYFEDYPYLAERTEQLFTEGHAVVTHSFHEAEAHYETKPSEQLNAYWEIHGVIAP